MKSYFFYMSHSLFLFRLANKLQPGAVKMNDTKKVTNAAMRTNKEVRNSFVANNPPCAQKSSQPGVKEDKQS